MERYMGCLGLVDVELGAIELGAARLGLAIEQRHQPRIDSGVQPERGSLGPGGAKETRPKLRSDGDSGGPRERSRGGPESAWWRFSWRLLRARLGRISRCWSWLGRCGVTRPIRVRSYFGLELTRPGRELRLGCGQGSVSAQAGRGGWLWPGRRAMIRSGAKSHLIRPRKGRFVSKLPC